MARGDKWPSRWWFWAFPALANAYLLPLVMLAFLVSRFPSPLLDGFEVIAVPFQFFLDNIVQPTFREWGWFDPTDLLLALGLWELAALLVGLVAYGGALLVHAIVGEPGREGEGNSDG